MRIGMRAAARARAEDVFAVVEGAEAALLGVIERECAALRAGKSLAARAIRSQLSDAAQLYLAALKAAQASLLWVDQAMPGARVRLQARRDTFAALLRIQLAALAAARAAANDDTPAPRLSA